MVGCCKSLLRAHVERALAGRALLFHPEKDMNGLDGSEMGGIALRAGSANGRCELHWKIEATISTAEAIRRKRKDLAALDELFDRVQEEQA